MAKEKIPPFEKVPKQRFIYPYLLLALHQLGGSARTQDAVENLARKFDLSDELLVKKTKNGRDLLFRNRVCFVRKYLVDTEYMEPLQISSYGIWALSRKGREKISDLIDQEESQLDQFREEIDSFRSKVKGRQGKKEREEQFEDESDELVSDEELAQEKREKEKEEQQLETIRNMNPVAFERLCGQLFKAMGYEDVKQTQGSYDGGIDGEGYWRSGLVKSKIVFQSKNREKGKQISGSVIRELEGARKDFKAEKAVIITTAGFSDDAKKRADSLGIECISGDRLLELLKEYGLGYLQENVITEYKPNAKIVTTLYEFDEDFFKEV